jgi:hypothetical protein
MRSRGHTFCIDLAQALEVVEDLRQLFTEVFDVFFAQPNARQPRDMLYLRSRKGQTELTPFGYAQDRPCF